MNTEIASRFKYLYHEIGFQLAGRLFIDINIRFDLSFPVRIELTLEDGSKVQLEYREFSIGKRRKQQVAEIVSRQKDETNGSEIFKVRRLEDKKEFSVDSRFIN